MAWMPFSLVSWVSLLQVCGIGEIFCGDGEEELLLDVHDCQGFDEESVGEVGDQGLRPGNGVRRDGSLDQVFLGQVAQVQGYTLMFHFRGEEEVIFST